MTARFLLGLGGIGKIARDRHLPAISASEAFELAATASRNGRVDGVDGFGSMAEMLDARPDIACVSLCTPPHVRFADARLALLAGRHLMIEKPPGATVAEVQALAELARSQGVTLFASWHSRHATSVAAARDWLAGKPIRRVEIVWKEDVRRWHPGQEWVWEPGALGVFDPGINALSVLTEIFPRPLHLESAELSFPANRATPIAAVLRFHDAGGAAVGAEFDWRQEGPQSWDIAVDCAEGRMLLSQGGARLVIDGREVSTEPDHEYAGLYARFAALVTARRSEVDLRPLVHVADAFMLGRRREVEPFHF